MMDASKEEEGEERYESMLYERWLSMRRLDGAEEEKSTGKPPLIEVRADNSEGSAGPRTWPSFVESESILNSVSADVGLSEEISKSAECMQGILKEATASDINDTKKVGQVINPVEPKALNVNFLQERPLVYVEAITELSALVGQDKRQDMNAVPKTSTPRTPPPTQESHEVAAEIINDDAAIRGARQDSLKTPAEFEAAMAKAMRDLEDDVSNFVKSAAEFAKEEEKHDTQDEEDNSKQIDLILAAAEASSVARGLEPPDAAQPALDATMLAIVANADGQLDHLAEPIALAHPGIKYASPPKPPVVPEEIVLNNNDQDKTSPVSSRKKIYSATRASPQAVPHDTSESLVRSTWSPAENDENSKGQRTYEDEDDQQSLSIKVSNEERVPATELDSLVDSCLRRENSTLPPMPAGHGIPVRSQPRLEQKQFETRSAPSHEFHRDSEPILNTGAIYSTFRQRLALNDSRLHTILNHSRAVLDQQTALLRAERNTTATLGEFEN